MPALNLQDAFMCCAPIGECNRPFARSGVLFERVDAATGALVHPLRVRTTRGLPKSEMKTGE